MSSLCGGHKSVDVVVQLFFTLVLVLFEKAMKRKQCEKHAISRGSPSDAVRTLVFDSPILGRSWSLKENTDQT
jgi:hypothetical protein